MNKYQIHDINHFGVLKVGFPLLLIFAFLTRHWWLSGGVLMSRSPGVMGSFFDGSVTYYMVAEFPALLISLLAMKRKPGAGKIVRSVWKHGFWLLSLSALLNMAMIALLPAKLIPFPARLSVDLSRLDGAQWGAIAANIAILAYFVLSSRTRDTFAEFPPPPAAPDTSKS
jgi:hypothetical protein